MHLCVQYVYIWLLGRALENDVVAEDQGRVLQTDASCALLLTVWMSQIPVV